MFGSRKTSLAFALKRGSSVISQRNAWVSIRTFIPYNRQSHRFDSDVSLSAHWAGMFANSAVLDCAG